MLRIDLNCDTGEGAGTDAAVMQYITSANIACGVHAGDARTMHDTLVLAAENGVAAGAHPGYPDRDGFGRRSMSLAPRDVYDTVAAQVAALIDAAHHAGVLVTHVKPHGALYNDAARDPNVARAIVRAVHDAAPGLMLYALAGSVLITEAELVGVRAIGEAFADRSYERDGTLTPREHSGAVIEDPDAAAARVVRIVTRRLVQCRDGTDISVHAGTICIHGDNPRAPDIAREARRALVDAGIHVSAPANP